MSPVIPGISNIDRKQTVRCFHSRPLVFISCACINMLSAVHLGIFHCFVITHTHVHTHMHVDRHTHTHTHARTHARTHTHRHTQTHTDTHTHARTHTHTHTHENPHESSSVHLKQFIVIHKLTSCPSGPPSFPPSFPLPPPPPHRDTSLRCTSGWSMKSPMW